MLYSLCKNDKVVGLFDTLENCQNFLKSVQLINEFDLGEYKIKEFMNNSLIKTREIKLKSKNTVKKTSNEDDEKNKEEAEAKFKEKKEVNKNVQDLKKKKEKLEEMTNMFKADLKVYTEFKKQVEEGKLKEIPEIFEEKYFVLKKLEESNLELTMINYYKNYQIKKSHNNCWNNYF